ncbi:type II secretion system protein GspL [Roseateles koreensis]|uniref:Type II secretion system protein GspL n=1 Tax=Roseateles koreensis TaxID=2987526 RepID=A0ABT5KRB5_9BURK|nr:type II secretion system protein GspL [Roseateles koreensis]MDC8785458.1 type II secretion system protein GspL [Roseateles koreensis]
MSTLLVFLPPRSRLRAQGRAVQSTEGLGHTPATALNSDYDFLLTGDGQHILSQGTQSASQLPHADTVIVIPADSDVAWQRVQLPKAGRQMRAALAGMLEESLLDDPEHLHFALEPGAQGADLAWVALCERNWLQQHLSTLEAAHVFVDRVTPLSWPESPRGHFYTTGLDTPALALRWSHPDGVSTLPLNGGLARQLLPAATDQDTLWSATPEAAAAAEAWLGAAVTLLSPAQRALRVIDSPWNLRQFELAQRTRGTRTLRQFYRSFMQREWQAVRWGLAGLVLVQLLGLNLLAWQQRQQLQTRQAALGKTLLESYPRVRAVYDAPTQMRRETDGLRAMAGRPGAHDLESLLSAAATAWPADRGPMDSLSFEPGRLVLSAVGWSEAQIQEFRSRLRSEGWMLDASEGKLTLSRARIDPRNSKDGGAGARVDGRDNNNSSGKDKANKT